MTSRARYLVRDCDASLVQILLATLTAIEGAGLLNEAGVLYRELLYHGQLVPLVFGWLLFCFGIMWAVLAAAFRRRRSPAYTAMVLLVAIVWALQMTAIYPGVVGSESTGPWIDWHECAYQGVIAAWCVFVAVRTAYWMGHELGARNV